MKLKKYTEQDLRKYVAESLTIRETLEKLGVAPAGGNYEVIKKAINYFKIDSRHLKGKTHSFKTRPISEILVHKKLENTSNLKKRLIKDEIKKHQCECCGLSEWVSEKIPLELHHRDGDRTNNTIENLELLCPNCHALTANYRRPKITKAKKKQIKIKLKVLKTKYCEQCNKTFVAKKGIKFCCLECSSLNQRKTNRPNKEELLILVKELGWSATGRKFGVRDNAIRKWLK